MTMHHFPSFELELEGTMSTLSSHQIRASRCGVGCETLDRDYFDPIAVFPKVAELGVKWARLQTGWIKCEKQPGQYDFAWLDWQVDTLLKLGIQPWFNLGYGNPLYTPEAGPGAEEAVGKAPLNSFKAMAGWLRFVEALVTHFRQRIHVYEVWNEPDHPKFWCDRERSGDQYARLYDPTQTAIRRANPDARVAALAMTGNALTSNGHRYIRDFFEHLADPAMVDIVTFHPYRSPPDRQYAEDLEALRVLVAEYNPQAEIWQGECGYPSKPGGTGGSAGGAINTENNNHLGLMHLGRILAAGPVVLTVAPCCPRPCSLVCCNTDL